MMGMMMTMMMVRVSSCSLLLFVDFNHSWRRIRNQLPPLEERNTERVISVSIGLMIIGLKIVRNVTSGSWIKRILFVEQWIIGQDGSEGWRQEKGEERCSSVICA